MARSSASQTIILGAWLGVGRAKFVDAMLRSVLGAPSDQNYVHLQFLIVNNGQTYVSQKGHLLTYVTE